MAIKRLTEGFGIGEDSCVSGRHPMTEQDILKGTEGVYLGNNPESPSKGLYITYYEADEIAQKIGFPHIGVYEEQKRLIDEQAAVINALQNQLDAEVSSLQLQAILKEMRKSNKELLNAVEGYSSAVRARLGNSGSDAKPAARTARPAGATSAK